MSAAQLFTILTQVTTIWITLLMLVEYLRFRNPTRFDGLLLFGDFALIVVDQWVTASTRTPPAWLGELSSLLLVAHPYLLFRVVQHLRPVSPSVRLFAVAGLVFSWFSILFFSNGLPPLYTILITAYFAFLEIYCAWVLVRGAFSTRGVTHWRLILAASGSLLIAVLILLAGLQAVSPATRGVLAPLSPLVGLSAILCYYLGFVPPAWLRRSWRDAELHRFLSQTSGQWQGETLEQTLLRLCSAAERATGGYVAAALLWDEAQGRLVTRVTSAPERLSPSYPADHPALLQAWNTCQPAMLPLTPDLAPQEPGLAPLVGSGSVLIAPITAPQAAWGLLLVFLLRHPLFASDDLALLSLFGEQAATTLGYLQLLSGQQAFIEQLQRYTERLEVVHEIDRSILSATSTPDIARVILARLRQLAPCEQAGVILFSQEPGADTFVAADSEMDPVLTPGRAFPPDAIASLAAPENQVISIPDLLEIRAPIFEQLRSAGVRSLVVVPLLVEGSLFGQISLLSRTPHAFKTEHEKIAREIADQLAITLQQATLREELQRYTEELEKRVADRTAQLESFTYSVSHDLRAPLRAIEGFSQIIQKNFAPELPEEGQKYFSLIRKNATEMSQLIDDLLSFSRLGHQELNRRVVEPQDLVRLVLRELLPPPSERKIEINLGELPPVEADPTLLKQVYANLLSNAIKFTSRCPEAHIEIGSQVQDGVRVFYVKDNGVGFDMKYAAGLFNVFQRLHRADEFEGTGVGLAIVQRIIERHGGRVWADAAVGAGASFYFTLGDHDSTPPAG